MIQETSPTLIGARRCVRSAVLVDFLRSTGVSHSIRYVKSPDEIGFSIYEMVPILKHGDISLEDIRLIWRHIIESLSVEMISLSDKERFELYSELDDIELNVLGPLQRLIGSPLDSRSYLGGLLAAKLRPVDSHHLASLTQTIQRLWTRNKNGAVDVSPSLAGVTLKSALEFAIEALSDQPAASALRRIIEA